MRILLDQGTPVALRNVLDRHNVSTTYEQGWQSLLKTHIATVVAAIDKLKPGDYVELGLN